MLLFKPVDFRTQSFNDNYYSTGRSYTSLISGANLKDVPENREGESKKHVSVLSVLSAAKYVAKFRCAKVARGQQYKIQRFLPKEKYHKPISSNSATVFVIRKGTTNQQVFKLDSLLAKMFMQNMKMPNSNKNSCQKLSDGNDVHSAQCELHEFSLSSIKTNLIKHKNLTFDVHSEYKIAMPRGSVSDIFIKKSMSSLDYGELRGGHNRRPCRNDGIWLSKSPMCRKVDDTDVVDVADIWCRKSPFQNAVRVNGIPFSLKTFSIHEPLSHHHASTYTSVSNNRLYDAFKNYEQNYTHCRKPSKTGNDLVNSCKNKHRSTSSHSHVHEDVIPEEWVYWSDEERSDIDVSSYDEIYWSDFDEQENKMVVPTSSPVNLSMINSSNILQAVAPSIHSKSSNDFYETAVEDNDFELINRFPNSQNSETESSSSEVSISSDNDVPDGLISLSSILIPELDLSDISCVLNDKNRPIILGKGSFGCVYLANLKDRTDRVVVKEFTDKATSVDDILREARILLYLKNTNTVPECFGIVSTAEGPSGVAIVQECVGGGVTLQHFLKVKPAPINRDGWLHICYGLAFGLRAIHKKLVLLNDIKHDNILVERDDHKMEVKFIDMGYATFKTSHKFGGSPDDLAPYFYLAPEVRQGRFTSTKSDIYSLGHVFEQVMYKTGHSALANIVQLCKRESAHKRPSLELVMDNIAGML